MLDCCRSRCHWFVMCISDNQFHAQCVRTCRLRASIASVADAPRSTNPEIEPRSETRDDSVLAGCASYRALAFDEPNQRGRRAAGDTLFWEMLHDCCLCGLNVFCPITFYPPSYRHR